MLNVPTSNNSCSATGNPRASCARSRATDNGANHRAGSVSRNLGNLRMRTRSIVNSSPRVTRVAHPAPVNPNAGAPR